MRLKKLVRAISEKIMGFSWASARRFDHLPVHRNADQEAQEGPRIAFCRVGINKTARGSFSTGVLFLGLAKATFDLTTSVSGGLGRAAPLPVKFTDPPRLPLSRVAAAVLDRGGGDSIRKLVWPGGVGRGEHDPVGPVKCHLYQRATVLGQPPCSLFEPLYLNLGILPHKLWSSSSSSAQVDAAIKAGRSISRSSWLNFL